MAMEPVSIVAPNKRKHAEMIYDLIAEQWRDDLRRHSREGRIAHSHYDWRASRIAIADNRVVAHFGVYKLTVRVGSAYVKAAGVNLVVTSPDYRKRGLMPSTIRASQEAMRAEGYDISIICNAIGGYYTRFGFVSSWPENDYTVRARDLPHDKPPYQLHAFKPRRRADLDALYNSENIGLTGTAVRPTFLRTKEPGDLTGYTWAGPDGQTKGYIIYDIISNGRAIWHYDSAGDADERLAVLGYIAHREDADEVRFNRISHNSALCRKIRTINCTAELTYRPTGGWMARVVNVCTLMEKLKGELSARLQNSPLRDWSGDLLIAHNAEEVTLRIDHGIVTLLPNEAEPEANTHYHAHTIRGGEHLIQLILGSDDPQTVCQAPTLTLTGDGPALAQALFPAQQPQMGNADL